MGYNSKYTGLEVESLLEKAGTAIQEHQDISGKQDKLVSGTNIKTVNGTSLLGSGNIETAENIPLASTGISVLDDLVGVENITYSNISAGQYGTNSNYSSNTIINTDPTQKKDHWNNASGVDMDFIMRTIDDAKIDIRTITITLGSQYAPNSVSLWYMSDGSLVKLQDIDFVANDKNISYAVNTNGVTSNIWVARFEVNTWVNVQYIGMGLSGNNGLMSYSDKAKLDKLPFSSDLAIVATSGSYNDLSNKPTIDTFQTRTGTTHSISSFTANTVYSCNASGNTTKITISGFANPTPTTRAAYYTIVFRATSCTFTVPSTVMWVGGNAIEFDSSTAYTYEVNFMKIQLSQGVHYLATWNRY